MKTFKRKKKYSRPILKIRNYILFIAFEHIFVSYGIILNKKKCKKRKKKKSLPTLPIFSNMLP